MALTFNGTSANLIKNASAGSAVPGGFPLTIFCWTRLASPIQGGMPVDVQTKAADSGVGLSQSLAIYVDANNCRAYSNAAGGSTSAFSTRAPVAGSWVPAMAVFADSSNRVIFYGAGSTPGSAPGLNAVNLAQASVIGVGNRAIEKDVWFKGDLACIGIWHAALGAADFATLAAGAVPSTVQPGALVDYWSLLTQSPTQTGVNGGTLVATNTVQAATHPIVEGGGDTTPPVLTGAITVSNLTGTSYTLAWPAGTDDVAVAGYERSLDGGGTWLNVGNVLSVAVSGRTSGTTDQVQVRARDAAGNRSSPPLSTTVTLPDTVPPTLVGSITVSGLTSTSYTLAWPAGSDNVGITAYQVSLDGGATWSSAGNALGANVSGRTPGTTDAVQVRAVDAAGNASAPLSTTVLLPPPPADNVPPTLTGTLAASSVTSTSYVLTWPAASDNVGVVGYERSLDGGASWVDVGNVLSVNITGRSPGTTDQASVRARDAAGNRSNPPLATNVSLMSSGGGATLITPPLKNNTGTLLANLSGVTVNVYNPTTGALVLQKNGLTSNSAGVVSIVDPTLVAGTTYVYEVVTASSGRRLPLAAAT